MQIQNGILVENDGSEVKRAHTPGPWMVDGLDIENAGGVAGGMVGEGIPIATMRRATVWLDADTQEANAALIAAAPDLLEALQMLSLACTQAERKPALTKASFAIAKATQED